VQQINLIVFQHDVALPSRKHWSDNSKGIVPLGGMLPVNPLRSALE